MLALEFNAGYISSSVKIDKSQAGLSSKDSYQAGASAVIGRQSLKFETGLYYAERGFRASGLGTVDGRESVASLDAALKYLEVPLLARYHFIRAPAGSLFLRAGVIAAFFQNADATLRYTDSFGVDRSYSKTDNRGISDFEGRGLVGLGTTLNLNRSLFVVGNLDYQRGFTDMSTSGENVKSQSFGVTLGLGLKI